MTIQSVQALDLVLDHGRHRITRGARAPVDLGGQVRQWQVLTQLCWCFDNYCSVADLRSAVWGDYDASESTIYEAVSNLRRSVRPLGLTVKSVKRLGYLLSDGP